MKACPQRKCVAATERSSSIKNGRTVYGTNEKSVLLISTLFTLKSLLGLHFLRDCRSRFAPSWVTVVQTYAEADESRN